VTSFDYGVRSSQIAQAYFWLILGAGGPFSEIRNRGKGGERGGKEEGEKEKEEGRKRGKEKGGDSQLS